MSRIARWIAHHPSWVLGAIGLVTLVFAVFLPRIGFQADYSKMLPAGDPVVAQYDRTRDLFGGQSLFMLAMAAEDGGTLFGLPSLQKLYAVTAELEALKEENLVSDVVSPANVKVVEGTATALLVRPILPGPPATEEDVALFRKKALSERMVRDALVRADGSAAVIVLRLRPEVEEREDLMVQILSRLEGIQARYSGPERFYISGNAAFLVYVNRYMRQDLAWLLPIVIAMVVLVLFLSFRTVRGVLLPLGVVLVALIWTMGLLGLTGTKLTMISTFLPVVLVAVGSAYGIHVVNDFAQRAGAGEKRELVRATVEEMFTPVLGAALTTAAGFLTLLSSFLVPSREFGAFAAFGVVVAFVLAMTMIPALLALFPLSRRRTEGELRAGRALAAFLSRRPVLTVVGAILVLAAFLGGVPLLRVESDVTRYFRQDSPVVEGLKFVEAAFGGSQELSVVVDTGRRDGLKDPEVLRFMDRLQAFLEARTEVGATSALADLVKESYFTLRGDDPAYYAIPETSRAVAQVLLLYEMGGGEATGSLSTRDFARGRITARVRSVGLAGYDALTREVQAFVAQEKPAGVVDWYVTGSPSLYIQLSKKLIASQIMSLGTSFGAVGLIVAVLMVSLGAGLLALIPLVVAVAGNFGVMGFAGAYLDMATVMIASLTVGIGVDYAMHFLTRYRRERAKGADHAQALAETLGTAGRAIVINALTLSFGFLVMLLSRFGALVTFGWLISLTMVTSMVGALFILPAVLAWVPTRAYQPVLRWERVRSRLGLAGADPKKKGGTR